MSGDIAVSHYPGGLTSADGLNHNKHHSLTLSGKELVLEGVLQGRKPKWEGFSI